MKLCYCHTDFFRFNKGNYYEYYLEDSTFGSMWVTYDKDGDSDNCGYRFFINRNSQVTNYFDEYFYTEQEVRKMKLKKING